MAKSPVQMIKSLVQMIKSLNQITAEVFQEIWLYWFLELDSCRGRAKQNCIPKGYSRKAEKSKEKNHREREKTTQKRYKGRRHDTGGGKKD